jgi:hypothetical protein
LTEIVEGLAQDPTFPGGHALHPHFATPDPDPLPHGGGRVAEELLSHLVTQHGHQPPLAYVRIGEGFAGGEAIILDQLVRRSHAEDQDIADRGVAIGDIGLGRGPAGLERDGQGLRNRAPHRLRILAGDDRPLLHLADLLVGVESERNRQAADLEGVGADDRAGDVLPDVGVHALDHRDHGDQESYRDDDPEEGKERA